MGRFSDLWDHIRYFFISRPPAKHGGATDAPDRLEERRTLLTRAGLGIDHLVKKGDLGIAFSGGGIRSATISLGVTQSLVEEDRLLDFDYCSTVSGGGYFGSFLVSLFLPDRARGPNATHVRPDEETEKTELLAKKNIAFDALGAKARSVNLKNPGRVTDIGLIRNPIWWLREHSRYLAPNGTSDYLLAAVYMVRNWLAMIYVMTLPIALAALVLILFDSWILSGPGWLSEKFVTLGRTLNSPAWLLVFLGAFASLVAGAAFWSSEAMSNRGPAPPNASGLNRLYRRLATPRTAMSVVAGLSIGVAIGLLFLVAPDDNVLGFYRDFETHSPFGKAVAIGCALLALSSFFGLAVLITTWGEFTHDALVVEVRRRITRCNSSFVKVTLFLAALAIVDSLAIWLYHKLAEDSDLVTKRAAIGGALLPAIAWIINKAQEWGKEKDSLLRRLIGRSIWTVALLAGALMFLLLSVGLHMFIQSMVFDGQPWIGGTGELGPAFGLSFIILAALTLLTGWSTGFINLSSLHGLYASRLTRAYLGASNLNRLKIPERKTAPKHKGKAATEKNDEEDDEEEKVGDAKASIKDSEPGDQIPIDVYQRTPHLGPLHLINVTLNETRSPEGSQLLERDRKGVPMVFAPEGIFVNPAREKPAYKDAIPKDWDMLEAAGVEKLSVGQLCAISGAAASTAMGSQTTLGGALAMSFANIRLGYWWDAKGLFRDVPSLRDRPFDWIYQKGTRPLRTFYYLVNELIANYTRRNARLNLSDGGHFDNSGAYELLRRKVKGIVVCDNGADPDFRFGDLEVLIRKARIDLGYAIEVAEPETVKAVMGEYALPLFLNGGTKDWRERAASRSDRSGASSPDDKAHCLLLEAFDSSKKNAIVSRILWIKPRLFEGLPQDVIGYALAHPDFPHETTGDQFFNEAQWESYRALGYVTMSTLLAGPMGNVDALRGLPARDAGEAPAQPPAAPAEAKPEAAPAAPVKAPATTKEKEKAAATAPRTRAAAKPAAAPLKPAAKVAKDAKAEKAAKPNRAAKAAKAATASATPKASKPTRKPTTGRHVTE